MNSFLCVNGIPGDPACVDAADYARVTRLPFQRVGGAVVPGAAGMSAGIRSTCASAPSGQELRLGADLDGAAGVLRIHDQEAHPRVPPQVAPLLPLEGRVHVGAFAIVTAPDQAGPRLAVGHQGGQETGMGSGQEIQVRGRNWKRLGHQLLICLSRPER
jgi:hypothetical protein